MAYSYASESQTNDVLGARVVPTNNTLMRQAEALASQNRKSQGAGAETNVSGPVLPYHSVLHAGLSDMPSLPIFKEVGKGVRELGNKIVSDWNSR